MHHPTDRITHTTAFVTPVVEHWLEREIAQWVHECILKCPIDLSITPTERLPCRLNSKPTCVVLESWASLSGQECETRCQKTLMMGVVFLVSSVGLLLVAYLTFHSGIPTCRKTTKDQFPFH